MTGSGRIHPHPASPGALGDFRAWLPAYVQWSYSLSDCGRSPTPAEIGAHGGLLMCRTLTKGNLDVFLSYIEPAASWREAQAGPGAASPDLGGDLDRLLLDATALPAEALWTRFCDLRPFTDANGRCGRALWVWSAVRQGAAGAASGIAKPRCH